MNLSDEAFVKKTLLSAGYTTLFVVFIGFLFMLNTFELLTLVIILFLMAPVAFFVLFFYFFQLPVIKITSVGKEIDKEIVFAGRFLAVELESGVSLYNAMKNVTKNYPVIGRYFNDIIEKINLGTPIEDAITEAIELSPSDSFTKLLWQISNSLRTGSDIAEPLKTVIETLIKEQQIAVEEYGRKLNPLAMFYMMIAIILPSLGVTMFTILAIFVGLELNLLILLVIAGMIGFTQFMFVAMINSIRPPVEL
jgi:flagellar protein FlaJ